MQCLVFIILILKQEARSLLVDTIHLECLILITLRLQAYIQIAIGVQDLDVTNMEIHNMEELQSEL